ncbi:MAG: hypothetical protein ACK5G7_01000 [Erysipelotrichaceae bacterium]
MNKIDVAVHQFVLVDYNDFDGKAVRSIFYVVNVEKTGDGYNFIACKVSSRSFGKFCVKCEPDKDNKLDKLSYINVTKIHVFKKNQYVNTIGHANRKLKSILAVTYNKFLNSLALDIQQDITPVHRKKTATKKTSVKSTDTRGKAKKVSKKTVTKKTTSKKHNKQQKPVVTSNPHYDDSKEKKLFFFTRKKQQRKKSN